MRYLLNWSTLYVCLYNLLYTKIDESIECLCTLLRAIGSKFEVDLRSQRENHKKTKGRESKDP